MIPLRLVTLPTLQRECLLLRERDGLDYGTIARYLHSTPREVAHAIWQAREALREEQQT